MQLNPEGHVAYLHLSHLRMVQPVGPELDGWPPPERHLLSYSNALAPTRTLKFSVVFSLDFTPRLEWHILGLRPGAEFQRVTPPLLGPTARVEWWLNLVDVAIAFMGSPEVAQ